jgi:hypothetical protein
MSPYIKQVLEILPGLAIVAALFAWIVRSIIRKELKSYREIPECLIIEAKNDRRMERMEKKFDRIIEIVVILEGRTAESN